MFAHIYFFLKHFLERISIIEEEWSGCVQIVIKPGLIIKINYFKVLENIQSRAKSEDSFFLKNCICKRKEMWILLFLAQAVTQTENGWAENNSSTSLINNRTDVRTG